MSMGHVNNPGQDPAEGSRETIERELERSASGQKKSSGNDRKPTGGSSHENVHAGKSLKQKH